MNIPMAANRVRISALRALKVELTHRANQIRPSRKALAELADPELMTPENIIPTMEAVLKVLDEVLAEITQAADECGRTAAALTSTN